MRQYQIHYKRLGGRFAILEPVVNAALYDKPEVQDAIALIAARPHLVGAAVQIGDDELFNIVTFDQPAEAPRSFKFKTLNPGA